MNNNKGRAGIKTIIIIIALITLAVGAMYYGMPRINKVELENIKTDMMLIKAKGKEYCEQANFKLGTGTAPTEDEEALKKYLEPAIQYLKDENQNAEEEAEKNRLKFNNEVSKENYTSYKDIEKCQYIAELTQEDLEQIGLKNINTSDTEKYLIGFDIIGNKVYVYNTKGYEIEKDGTKITCYSLEELEEQ